MKTSFDDWLRHTLSANRYELDVMASIVLQRIAAHKAQNEPANVDASTATDKSPRRRTTGKSAPTPGKPAPDAIVTPPA